MLLDDESEMELYSKIIEVYQNRQLDKEAIEIWKDKSYIDLMHVLKRTNNKDLVKNAIILILSLFEDIPVDLYDTQGVDAKELKLEKRKEYLSKLKMEFFSEVPN